MLQRFRNLAVGSTAQGGLTLHILKNGICTAIRSVVHQLDALDRRETSPETYVSLLRSCTNAVDIKRVHRHILGSAHSRDRLLQNLLVEVYGKCGSLEDAISVFRRISRRNVYSWTMMLAAYAQQGHFIDAVRIFQEMLNEGEKPDRVAFLTVLQACTSMSQGKNIHRLVVEAELDSDIMLGNAFVTIFGKCGALQDAEMVFREMPQKDVVSWNSMLAVYAQNGECSKAVELFRLMDLKPDRVTYLSLLEACSSLEEGEEIHARILKDGLGSDIVVENALINMYGKNAALDKAMDVFEKMEERNIISWNTIIGSYTQNGYREKALELFRRMDLECVLPDKITYVHIFDATEASELKTMHERVSASGLDESDITVGNSLLHLHGKCGNLDGARSVFENMTCRSVSSWNSIVDVYANNGLEKEAFSLFRKMQQDGFQADKITFLNVFEACTDLLEGRQIHLQIISSGFQRDIAIQTALVQMYSKFGSLDEARDVFDDIEHRDIFAWNSLLRAYAYHGEVEEALTMFHEMMLLGVKPNEMTFVNMLDICASLGNLAQGIRIHDCATETGLEGSSVSVGNTLISMYSRCGSLKEAKSVFDKMQEKNVISWNAMLVAVMQQEYAELAFELLNNMQLEGFKPDKVTCITCLDACKGLTEAKKMHSLVICCGLETDTTVGNCLINTYRRWESLQDSKRVFDEMDDRNVITWTSMISCYGDSGFSRQASLLWQQMQLNGVKPDGVTFASVLEAISSLMTLELGKLVHAQVIQSGAEKEHAVGPALVAMYSGCGSLDMARMAFNGIESKRRDVFLCNAMLAAYLQHRDGRGVLHLFRSMDLEGIVANTVTIVTALDACATLGGGLVQAKALHGSITGCNLCNLIVQNTLVNMYSKCGSLKQARGIFETLPEKSIVSWNTMITSTAQHGESLEARRIFRRMQVEGIKPDEVTLMAIASSCQNAGQLEEAFYYMFQVCRDLGVKLGVEHYSCIVGVLARAGWLEEAEGIIRKMPFEPNVMVWKNLQVACKMHGDTKRGEHVTRELWKLDPKDSAPYIMLSNMYIV